jgi:hypothetical protein
MGYQPDLPAWNLKDVALLVFCHTDELAFLQANPTAVHPFLTPLYAWDSGVNENNEVLSQSNNGPPENSAGSHPAVLLLRGMPKHGGTYLFGRRSYAMPDVHLADNRVSRRHFCVYPDLQYRTWFIQPFSNRCIIVNDCLITSEEGDGTPCRRALGYDCLNRVVVAQTTSFPGLVLDIKPVWPSDSGYLHWDWQDPELAASNLSWTLTAPLSSEGEVSRRHNPADHSAIHVLERRLCHGIEIFYAQDLDTGAMLAAEKISTEHEAREQLSWRTLIKARVTF